MENYYDYDYYDYDYYDYHYDYMFLLLLGTFLKDQQQQKTPNKNETDTGKGSMGYVLSLEQLHYLFVCPFPHPFPRDQ